MVVELLEMISSPSDVTTGPKIGQGTYGIVYRGTFKHDPVALKIMKGPSYENDVTQEKILISTLYEALMLKQMSKSQNVVSAIGLLIEPLESTSTQDFVSSYPHRATPPLSPAISSHSISTHPTTSNSNYQFMFEHQSSPLVAPLPALKLTVITSLCEGGQLRGIFCPPSHPSQVSPSPSTFMSTSAANPLLASSTPPRSSTLTTPTRNTPLFSPAAGGIIISCSDLSNLQRIKIAADIFNGLCDMHDARICHRDITSGNVLFSKPVLSHQDVPLVLLSDLGLAAKASSDAAHPDVPMPHPAGTVASRSPEYLMSYLSDAGYNQLQSDPAFERERTWWRVDRLQPSKSDVFSAALLCVEVLSGKETGAALNLSYRNTEAWADAVALQGVRPSLSSIATNFGVSVASALQHAMASSPAERPSAVSMRQVLHDALVDIALVSMKEMIKGMRAQPPVIAIPPSFEFQPVQNAAFASTQNIPGFGNGDVAGESDDIHDKDHQHQYSHPHNTLAANARKQSNMSNQQAFMTPMRTSIPSSQSTTSQYQQQQAYSINNMNMPDGLNDWILSSTWLSLFGSLSAASSYASTHLPNNTQHSSNKDLFNDLLSQCLQFSSLFPSLTNRNSMCSQNNTTNCGGGGLVQAIRSASHTPGRSNVPAPAAHSPATSVGGRSGFAAMVAGANSQRSHGGFAASVQQQQQQTALNTPQHKPYSNSQRDSNNNPVASSHQQMGWNTPMTSPIRNSLNHTTSGTPILTSNQSNNKMMVVDDPDLCFAAVAPSDDNSAMLSFADDQHGSGFCSIVRQQHMHQHQHHHHNHQQQHGDEVDDSNRLSSWLMAARRSSNPPSKTIVIDSSKNINGSNQYLWGAEEDVEDDCPHFGGR